MNQRVQVNSQKWLCVALGSCWTVQCCNAMWDSEHGWLASSLQPFCGAKWNLLLVITFTSGSKTQLGSWDNTERKRKCHFSVFSRFPLSSPGSLSASLDLVCLCSSPGFPGTGLNSCLAWHSLKFSTEPLPGTHGSIHSPPLHFPPIPKWWMSFKAKIRATINK